MYITVERPHPDRRFTTRTAHISFDKSRDVRLNNSRTPRILPMSVFTNVDDVYYLYRRYLIFNQIVLRWAPKTEYIRKLEISYRSISVFVKTNAAGTHR